MNKVDLIYKDLSYELRGIFYEVHNELGQFRNEKQFCDRIEVKLKEKKLIMKEKRYYYQVLVVKRRGEIE